MLKLLIGKQFQECFRSYFVNPKTGQPRSKKSRVGMFILFAALMLFLAVAFFAIGMGVADALAGTELFWLYFSIAAIISTLLGVFGSVFNTYASLYLSKDNDLLLSMPIPPKTILLSRISLVAGLSLLYSGIVWVPMLICAWINQAPSVLSAIFGLLLTFVIAAFVTVVTCILGWVIAAIAVKLKNKSIVVVIISLVFFFAYYTFCMRFDSVLTEFLIHKEEFAGSMKVWGNLFYQIGRAANGNVLSMCIFTALTAVISFLCIYILSKSFIKIVTKTSPVKKTETKTVEVKAGKLSDALYKKELKRFLSSSVYMLNAGIGGVLLLVASVIMLVKAGDILPVLDALSLEIPWIGSILPIAVMFISGMLMAMVYISTPSISLEGKTLWIYKSLPISAYDIIKAKEKLHFVFSAVPSVISIILLGIAFKLDYSMIIEIICVNILFIYLMADFGLMIGLLRPSFDWTTETQPVKSSVNGLISMGVGWIVNVIACGAFFLVKDAVDINQYIIIVLVVFAVGCRLLKQWLAKKGTELFYAL